MGALDSDPHLVIFSTMTVMSLVELKAHLPELVGRHGKPSAVLIAPEDLESLEESLAILSDPQSA